MFYYMFVKLLSAICYYLLLLLLKCLSLNPDFLVLRHWNSWHPVLSPSASLSLMTP